MTVWLVRVLTVGLHRNVVMLRVWTSRSRSRSISTDVGTVAVGGADTLVCVGSLLGHEAVATAVSVIGRTSGTAARTQQPEKDSGESEGGCKPCGDEDIPTHGAMDA